MNLSKHLTLEQATKSQTAKVFNIPNVPDEAALECLRVWGEEIYDPIVERFGKVPITSAFRSVALNSHPTIGGSKTSSHIKGQAGDLDGDTVGLDNTVLFDWIRENLVFDQLIAEYEQNGRPKWVHVSYREGNNRQQVLIATKDKKGKTIFINYTPKAYLITYRTNRGYTGRYKRRSEVPTVDRQTASDEGINELLL